MTVRVKLPILLFVFLASLVGVTAQNENGKTPTLSINKSSVAAIMIDEFGTITSEERSSRFDSFYRHIAENPGSTGYVLLYCGRTCRYDEIAAHMRGIELKTVFRNFDRSRLTLQNAGFRESFSTELWLVPAGACPPQAKSSVNFGAVKFIMPRKRTIEHYECC